MLRISGCSRTQFNGDYIQEEGQFYYRRPIFHCLQTKMYLFYHGERGQWQIFRRTGTKASCCLKTKRTAHMPGEGVQWAVWKNSAKGKKGFALESQMVCSAIPELTQEEQLAKAEDCIKFDELYYKKVEKVLGERAVYRQSKGEDWGNTWIFYESAESRWKRGRELGSAAGASTSVFLNASRSGNEITDVPSPQLTVWMDETDGGKIDVVAVDTDGVPNTMGGTLRLNPSIPDGWKDKDFPHNETSIGKKVTSFGEPRWLRALALHPNPVLFADVEPADACQGRVGNCWLIAALSALAEYPSYFKKQVFITKKVSESGKYRIKLYDGRLLRWTIMEIDDYLPCSHYGGFKPELIFGKINDGKVCMALLEKAFAKLYGSYSALTAGFQPVAWHHLTGCKEFFRYKATYTVAVRWVVTSREGLPVYSDKRRSEKLGALAWGTHFHETQRIGSWIKFKKLTGSGPETGWLSYYDGQGGERVAKRDPEEHFRFMSWRVSIDPRQVMEAITGDVGKEGKGADACFKYHFSRYVYPDEMWEKLKNYDKENYLMACTATQCKSEVDCGMVHGHAYSILHAVEIDNVKLVACRNPWGSDSEWNGPWSDRSAQWKAHPKIAKALKVDFQTEGTFWMDWEDWQYIFGQCNVMNYQMPSTRGDFYKHLVAKTDELPADEEKPAQPDSPIHHDLIHDNEDPQSDPERPRVKHISIGTSCDELASYEDEDAESGGELLGCTGLGTWNAPVIMQEGTLTDPGEGKASARFVNVPKCLHGKTLFALKNSTAEPGTWMMEYYPPTKLYVWLQKGKTGMLPLDEFLPKRGWDHEPTDGFQTSDGHELLLFSKWLEEDEKYYALHTSWPIVGGVIGTFPLPKPPPVTPGDGDNCFDPVTKCTGLDVEWNGPEKMAEGTQTNPGEKDHSFQNVPAVLIGGSYIGSKCWPKAGTWTIYYQAPCKLYVWARQGEYNGGVDELLQAAGGWAREKAEKFQRSDGSALSLWSKHFLDGETYSLDLKSCMVGGVIGTPITCTGKVTKCSGLEIEWNAPQTMTEGTLTNPGDRDYVFENVPACLAGGVYIGSRVWPQAGVWTIEYEAPTMLYVWIQNGKYDAGVSEFLTADGWVHQEAGNFLRRQSEGINHLALFARHFAAGTSYSITTNSLMVGGVVSQCSEG
ncbi:Calpain-15 (Small optic lobes homolog) [Durusdinium trenchii]|uniref:Calpain-15 (Small optic lobes homolog) n=1 Tax=Durusdinium trenchii TaxID=1381693 RepID=A0ABP0J9Z8_9DINO